MTYAPGTVALVRFVFEQGETDELLCELDASYCWRSTRGHQVMARFTENIANVQPVQLVDPSKQVVIDPEDREVAARLCAAIPWLGEAPRLVDDMQAALRSLLTPPAPPIPECPEGCVAVVDDVDDVWTLRDDGQWCYPGHAKSWDVLWIAHGPLRPVGPVLSAGIGEAE